MLRMRMDFKADIHVANDLLRRTELQTAVKISTAIQQLTPQLGNLSPWW